MSAAAGVGAGRARILLDGVLPLDGFTHETDPLHVRALVVDDGERRVALVCVEMTSLPDAVVDDARRVVGDAAGTPSDRVLVAATHTFSAPHLSPRARLFDDSPLAAALLVAMRSAATQAAESLRPARMCTGSGTARIAVNRDVETAAGWWLGADDAGPTDPEVGILRFDDVAGAPVAVVFSAAVQSSVMNGVGDGDGDGRTVTSDLAGAAARRIEQQDADRTVALFLCGPAGDQAPYLAPPPAATSGDRASAYRAGLVVVDLLGQRLADVVSRTAVEPHTGLALQLSVEEVAVEGQAAPADFRDLAPSHDYRFTPDRARTVPIWVLRIAAAVVVGLRPELSASTGTWIKERSTAPLVIVATMVNGGAKYLPDDLSFVRRTYEAMSSRYARGAAEVVAARAVASIRASDPAEH